MTPTNQTPAYLFDTHTHFDVSEFDDDRINLAKTAYACGVRQLVLVGFLANRFDKMRACQNTLNTLATQNLSPIAHIAYGLHPFYITSHSKADLQVLDSDVGKYPSIAIGEIGLDTFTDEMKIKANYQKQQHFFVSQLDIATSYNLPVLLHIRKSHADTLKLLKTNRFINGGIAHSFSGGIQEAKAFVDLGFKIGITGQITNPNAKKLRTTVFELVRKVGADSIVIETDCPDFTPLPCHTSHGRRNTPDTLAFVLDELSVLLNIDKQTLTGRLWQNSLNALNLDKLKTNQLSKF